MLKRRIIIIVLAIFMLSSIIVSFVASNCSVVIKKYDLLSNKIVNDIKIIQLSDLHSKDFGKYNRTIVNKLNKLKPDLIIMTGDMIESTKSADVVYDLVNQLSDIAIVYYSLGNHELDYISQNSDFIQTLECSGATVLEKEYIDIDINGNSIRLGGVSGYALGVEFWEASKGKSAEEYYDKAEFSEQRFLLEFEATDRLKILLCHQPEGSTLWNNNKWFDVDFIFSGHIHGGMVRLPFIGGLYAPEEGYLPEFDYGLYEINGNTTYISSGLSNSNGVPRFNNIPEIVLFNLVSE